MKELARLRMRPSRDRGSFRYMLDYVDQFIQYCLGQDISAATVAKKGKHLKRAFQLAEDRGQLDQHPLRKLKPPRAPKRKIRVFTDDECDRLCKAAAQCEEDGRPTQWELLIRMCRGTGMRRGELMNATWRDIDFANMTVEVCPKKDCDDTWEWYIKDTDRRTLPLTADSVRLLVELQISQPEGNPYVFVPVARYELIQELRR
ncbi:MAG: tyrosine-type recombinase/integrase, partial [candidate division NC10 bacterium]|nr:tyrosine-type recombinase/integrase [candidate division NC10 bacterium]